MSPSSSWRRARSTTRTRTASTSPDATASCPRSRCARAKSGGAAWPPRPEPHAIARAHRAGRRRGGHAWLGDALFVVAGVLFALFTVGARHWRIDPLPATAAVWVLALPYVPIYGALAGSRVLDAPRGEVVFQAIFQGLGVAIVALALYAWAIRVLGDSRAALFMPLVPVCGVLLGVAVLGEVPEAVQVAGMAGGALGVAVAARQPR